MMDIIFGIAVLVFVFMVGVDVGRTETIAKMGDEVISAVLEKSRQK